MSKKGQGGYLGAGFQVNIPYPFISIKNIQVNRAFNDHSYCDLSLVMTEESATACLEKGSFKDTVQIHRKLDSATQYWFSGGITGVDINVEDGIWHVSIKATSRTYDMDHKRKSHSYQNKNKTYTSLIKEVVAPYPGGAAMNEATHPDAKIGELLVQYEETDFEFLRRLASKVGTVILPDVVLDAPRVYFGVPDFSWGKQLEAVHYTVTQNQEQILQFEGSSQNISYKVHSEQYVQVGDNVSFHGQMWVVYKAEMNYHEGITVYTYQLVQRASIRSMVKQNHRIQGVSLGGKVVQRGNNMVKVHLDVDDEHDEGGNWWFPYSSEGNNMFHALPEEGARINVYFPGGKEKQAIAINSVRGRHEEMKGRTVFQKPNTKVFHIPGNAKMELGEEGVLFEKNTVRLHLNADDITLEAEENLLIVGSHGIELGSQEQMPDYIKMRAETSITVFTGKQVIEILSQRTAIKAEQINVERVEMSLLDMMTDEDIEEVYLESILDGEVEKYQAEKAAAERDDFKLSPISVNKDWWGYQETKKEARLREEERAHVKEKTRKRIREEPGIKEKARASVEREGEYVTGLRYRDIHATPVEEPKRKSKTAKQLEQKEYDKYYKSYVDEQKRRRELEKRAALNSMDKLTDANPQEALRQESEMLRASARSQERKQALMSDGKEPSLIDQLATAFLDWYNLEYIVPQKPEYLSKDQSNPMYYSRYFIEQFLISPQKKDAYWNLAFGFIAILTAIPTGGSSLYLFAVLNVAWGVGQVAVSSMKLEDLQNGEYASPKLDATQGWLDTTGTALAVVDLAFLAKSAGKGIRNLATDTTRAEMLAKVKNPAVKQGLDKIGQKLGQTGKLATETYDNAKSMFNVGKTGQLGLDAVGAGSKTGRIGSRAVDGAETWYSSGKSNSKAGTKGIGQGNIQLGKEELNSLRKKWNVPETDTIAVGKTDVKGLEDLNFEGGSPMVRKEAGLPDLDEVFPNREIRAPYDYLNNPKLAQFTRHAEEGVISEFDVAIKNAGLKPSEVTGNLRIHQSNPRGVCNKCSKGLLNPFPLEKSGIFYKLSKKYPNLTIIVTSEIDESVKVNGLLSFILKDGKIIN